MRYYSSMHDLIGHTPMVRISDMGVKPGVNVFAKLELYNPSGSVKDRTGWYMVRDAEQRGILKKGGTIIEGTAGNTGLGIAFAALGKGYRVIFDGMLGAVAKAREIEAETPGAVLLGQFTNPANPKAHYETTGPEIYEDLDGQIDYFVAGAGSGGTYSGVMKYLRERNPKVVGVLADPVGSTMGGGEHADYNIEGIGNDFIADTMDMSLVDRVIKVNDDEAFSTTRLLASREGIICGSSSGAAMAAVLKLAPELEGANIVTLFPDRGDRYFSDNLYA